MCLIVYMYPISMKCPERPEEGSRSPKAGVTVVNYLAWVLGTKLKSSGRIASTLNYEPCFSPQQILTVT